MRPVRKQVNSNKRIIKPSARRTPRAAPPSRCPTTACRGRETARRQPHDAPPATRAGHLRLAARQPPQKGRATYRYVAHAPAGATRPRPQAAHRHCQPEREIVSVRVFARVCWPWGRKRTRTTFAGRYASCGRAAGKHCTSSWQAAARARARAWGAPFLDQSGLLAGR